MRTIMQAVHQRAWNRSKLLGRRLARDENGVTAIEFAAVGVPFFMMLFGIMGVGLYFFSIFNLENAVETASRPFRTGTAETLYPLVNNSAADKIKSKSDFSKAVCAQLAPFFDCDNKLRVQVVNVTEWQAIAGNSGKVPEVAKCLGKADPAVLTTPDILIPEAQTVFNVPKPSEIMVVTVCYELDLLQHIPFIKLGNMPSGATMLQAAAAFKNEPYK